MDRKDFVRICYDIPRELKKRLIIRAAEKETSQSKIIIEALNQYLFHFNPL